MTDATIISNVNGFTEIQKAYFDLISDNKIYTENTNGRISQAQIDEAEDTADAINLLSQQSIDNNISPSLNTKNKLSSRPC